MSGTKKDSKEVKGKFYKTSSGLIVMDLGRRVPDIWNRNVGIPLQSFKDLVFGELPTDGVQSARIIAGCDMLQMTVPTNQLKEEWQIS